jgi:8-amino-7-oxononanoate synthase
MSTSALARKLAAALASREDRDIILRLPSPSLSLPPPTPNINRSDASTSTTVTTSETTTIIPAAPASDEPTRPPPAAAPTDFSSNDFLSLSSSPLLRARLLAALNAAPSILGSGGSRILVYNHAHATLEARLARSFRAPAALLFNSGFDANAGFFACIPQPGDALIYDAAIHASVHDGVRASRIAPRLRRSFAHNDVRALRAVLRELRAEYPVVADSEGGESSVFVAVESVYSMDGTVAPLREMLDVMEEVFPERNAHLVVDEAHATGIYGPGGRGMVALLGLEDRVLARLHTFGKALAASGGVCAPKLRGYMR